MKEWACVGRIDEGEWLKLATEARVFVKA